MHRMVRPAGFTTGWRSLPWLIIQAVLSGGYRLDHAGGSERLAAGTLWFIPVGCRHCHAVAGPAPAEVAWWHGGIRWHGTFDAFAGRGAPVVVPGGVDSALGRALLALFPPAAGDGLAGQLARQLRETALAAELATLLGDPPVSPASDQLAPVFRFIEANLHLPLARGELAARAGLAPSRFHELFLAATGEPPMSWVRRCRLERAAALLVGSDLGMTAIAERVGLCDAFHLNKRFRQRYGMPPTEFRRRGGG